VFDEKRYFEAGTSPCVVEIQGVMFGITVCEDIWTAGACIQSKNAGAEVIINLNASPFELNKLDKRRETLRNRAQESHLPIVYVNQIGGQDELVFDGASFVMNETGVVTQSLKPFEEILDVVEFARQDNVSPVSKEEKPGLSDFASIYSALVLGVRDYVTKNKFSGAVLGLSGGIDSALTMAIAVDALGADQVEVLLMPSRYTADMSNEDAVKQAKAMDVGYDVIPIEPAVNAFSSMLADAFDGLANDVTEENIQARCRGVLLMAISNKKRKILLTTGNKSEMSVGYATLYGDMAGGFAPIKDVPKLMVYALATYRNEISPVIPKRVIDRPPSAELAPDQKDEDSLPPHTILDDILARYIEQDESREEIIASGFETLVVDRVLRRWEEHTSELQSRQYLVCRLLL